MTMMIFTQTKLALTAVNGPLIMTTREVAHTLTQPSISLLNQVLLSPALTLSSLLIFRIWNIPSPISVLSLQIWNLPGT